MARALPLAALLALLLASAAGAEPRFAPGVLIVKLRADDDLAALDRLQREIGAREPRALFRRESGARMRAAARAGAAAPALGRIRKLSLPAGVLPEQAAALAAADPGVEWAQPDLLLVPDFVPDDPFFLSSGSWGQPYADLWGLQAIRAPEAWAYTRGEGAVIAVVDSGLDYTHPDAADNVWVNPGEDQGGDGRATDADRNGVDDDGNGFVDDLIGFDFQNSLDANGDGDYVDPEDVSDADPFDDNGHGTHVAGTAAAVGGNGIGVIGVAPRAKLMALKGFPAAGSAASSALARAIVYAADNGADVINASWSCGERCTVNPLIDEAVRYAHALGTVYVDSAGNSGDDVVFYSPEKRRETIVVAATNEDHSHASFSSVGFLVDVAAPGAGRQRAGDPFSTRAILSMLSSGAPEGFSAGLRVGDAWLRLAGTSMSTPHVAGVVALIRSLHPDATPEDVRALLRATARDVGPPGHDRLFGAGIVDALAAVTRRAPQVRGVFDEPGPGAILDARGDVIEILGSADGADFASYALAYGRGMDPAAWHPIEPAGDGPVSEGLLARWPVGALDVGPFVLRLDVTSRAGELVREFLPVSLERNLPFAVSSLGPDAFAPDLSGDLAVWEQQSGLPDGARDVFAKDLRRGREIAVAEERGDQRFPRVSGKRIAFLDRALSAGGEIATCALDTRAGRCEPALVATGPERRSGPV
ncbi:MAG TPA: S8 family serine peptidase, partial [Myxococcota bacterium]|nr:S8 family serine peptidase [Myxococcota bacterium]